MNEVIIRKSIFDNFRNIKAIYVSIASKGTEIRANFLFEENLFNNISTNYGPALFFTCLKEDL